VFAKPISRASSSGKDAADAAALQGGDDNYWGRFATRCYDSGMDHQIASL
jgi:hypothetical protein